MVNIFKKIVSKVEKEWSYLNTNQRPILFDHLPKCGGSSIKKYLIDTLPYRLVYDIPGLPPRLEKFITDFKGFSAEKRQKYKLVQGHLANQLLDYVHPESIVLVVLREPIDRIVSHYFYVKRTPDHYLHNKVIQENISLEEYCYLDLSNELENWYITHFTGWSLDEVRQRPEEALDLAWEVLLKKYHIIGFLDNIPATVEAIAELANIKLKFDFKVVNKTKNRTKIEDIDTAVIDRIMQKNDLDLKLYNRLITLRGDKQCIFPPQKEL